MDINKVIEAEYLAEYQRQEAMADEFLKDRLEYYVAQVVAGKIVNVSNLIDIVAGDFRAHIKGNIKNIEVLNIVHQRINDELKKLDIYSCYYGCDDYSYKDIKTIDPYYFQSKEIEDRLIELGLKSPKENEELQEQPTEQPKPSNAHWFLFAIIVSNFIGVLIGVCIK